MEFSLPGAPENFTGCVAGKRLKQSHLRSSPGRPHPSKEHERCLSLQGVVLGRKKVLGIDLPWNKASSKIWARKPLNPAGQKSFASNELSALGGEPEPDITQTMSSDFGFLLQLPPSMMECVLPVQKMFECRCIWNKYILKHTQKKRQYQKW